VFLTHYPLVASAFSCPVFACCRRNTLRKLQIVSQSLDCGQMSTMVRIHCLRKFATVRLHSITSSSVSTCPFYFAYVFGSTNKTFSLRLANDGTGRHAVRAPCCASRKCSLGGTLFFLSTLNLISGYPNAVRYPLRPRRCCRPFVGPFHQTSG
jgi:hypothetical protein